MMTTDKFDNICLIGHTFIDQIVSLNYSNFSFGKNNSANFNEKLGGIWNVSNALLELNIRHEVVTSMPTSIKSKFDNQSGEFTDTCLRTLNIRDGTNFNAIIIQNRQYSSRTSITDANSIRLESFEIKPHTLYQFSYADLYDEEGLFEIFQIIKEKQSLISIDLCVNRPSEKLISKIRNSIKYINFLLISQSELEAYFGNYKNLMKLLSQSNSNLFALIHYENKIKIITKNSTNTAKGELIKGRLVLGMGDRFVSYFLGNLACMMDPKDAGFKAFADCQLYLKESI